MHTRFPYAKRAYYPHMKPADVVIWERFIDKYPEAYDEVAYDFAMGQGPNFSTIVNPATGGDDLALYQWKADVLGFKDNVVDVIEVKPRAGISAIGQSCCYKCLWHARHCVKQQCNAVLITDELRPDMKFLCKQMGVKIIVV